MASFFFAVVFGTRTQKALHSPVVVLSRYVHGLDF